MVGVQDFEPVLTEYTYDLKAGNRSPGTIRNYTYTLGLWNDWLVGQVDAPAVVADIRKEHVSRWVAERSVSEAPETVLTRYRHLRAFFKWAEREEIVEKNPMATMREPTSPEQPAPVLSSEQLRAIFAGLKSDKSFAGVRDFAMLLMLADTGCRVGELVGMRLEDVDFDTGTVEVLGKGRRRRNIAFGARSGKALLAYLRARARQKGAEGTEALWTGARGPLHEAAVWKIVRDRSADAGVLGVHPHLFRHTFAHRFRLKGGQEGDLASLGGWRSPKMLARYGASAASDRDIEAHQRVDHLGDVL
jgi:site-specific recombinase XerD